AGLVDDVVEHAVVRERDRRLEVATRNEVDKRRIGLILERLRERLRSVPAGVGGRACEGDHAGDGKNESGECKDPAHSSSLPNLPEPQVSSSSRRVSTQEFSCASPSPFRRRDTGTLPGANETAST